MILKGNARENGKDLANHLQRTDTNERVEVAEVRGFVSDDLEGAFAEIKAIASGTRAEKYLYSLSINPNEPLTRDQYGQAIELIEERLNFTDQPRAIVFHEKDGREHCHVVWSKINAAEMKAIHLHLDRQTLRSCAQELSREFGHELPEGLKTDKGSERYAETKGKTFAELKQEERTGLSVEERRAKITEAYQQSDNMASFSNALENQGLYLCRGDQRGFVVVDMAGEVHSLAKQINGANIKAIKTKLNLGDPAALMSVQEAKLVVMDRSRAAAEHRTAESRPSPAERQQSIKAEIKAVEGDFRERLAELRAQQSERITEARAAIKAAYREEWRDLFKQQRAEMKELEKLKNPLARLKHFLQERDRSKIGDGNGGFLRGAFHALVKGQPKLERLEKVHKAERRQVGDLQKLATNEEIKEIKREISIERKEATRSNTQKIGALKKSLARSGKTETRAQSSETKKPASAKKSFSDIVREKTSAEAMERINKADQKRREQERGRDNTGRTRG